MRAREFVAWVLCVGLAAALGVLLVRSSAGPSQDKVDQARMTCSMMPGVGSIYSDDFKNCVAQQTGN